MFIILLAIGWTEFSCPVGYIPTLQNFVYIFILIFPKLYWKNNLVYLPITQYNLWQIRFILPQHKKLALKFPLPSIILSSLLTKRFNSTKNVVIRSTELEGSKLNPMFISGFTDGEGCYHVALCRSKDRKIGWAAEPGFQITLHVIDLPILVAIQNSLGVGRIYKKGSKAIQLQVRSLEELDKVMSHFQNYNLITKKEADFKQWQKVIIKMKNKEHLTLEGLREIVALKASMNLGLSEKLRLAFPNVVPVKRPEVELPLTIDPNWLAGFTSAEGSFIINIKKSNTRVGIQVILVFQLTQHSRDEKLIKSLIQFFGCGAIYKRGDRFDYKVLKFDDIVHRIIPFFRKFPIVGIKSKDFEDFCRVSELMKKKAHLTLPGLEKIKKIKAGMNTGRKLF